METVTSLTECTCGDCLNVVVDSATAVSIERRFCIACEEAGCEARGTQGQENLQGCNVRDAYDRSEDYALASLRRTGII
jgi:hypothetical protein